MKEYEATEIAFKNGYEKGYTEAIKEFAERVKKECFYWDFIARKYRACTDLTHNHIDQIAKEVGGEK